MRTLSGSVSAAFSLAVLAGGFAHAQAPAPPTGDRAITVAKRSTMTATVQSVDQNTRAVTLKSADGETFTLKAPPDPGGRPCAGQLSRIGGGIGPEAR